MKTISIRWRLFLVFMLLLIPICVLIYVFQGKVFAVMKQQAGMYTAQYIEKISYDIELNLSELDKMAVALQRDAGIQKALLSNDTALAQARMDESRRENPLAQSTGSQILLLNRGQRVVASTYDEWTGLLRTLGPEWLNKIIEARGGRVLISGYSITKGTELASTKVISIARGIFTQEDTLLGYLMIEVPIKAISQICQGVSLGNNGYVALVDMDDYVIYNTHPETIGSKFMHLTVSDTGKAYQEAVIRGVDMLVVEVPASVSGIRVIGAIPVRELEEDLIFMRRWIYVGMSLLLAVILAAVSLLTNWISRPILEMEKAMERVKKGDFSVRIPETRSDEIGNLQKGFNHMVEQVDQLIAREYDSVLRQREAQLNEMMAVINPHFIYNTLETISMTAYLHDDNEVVEMIGHLGDMFRSMTADRGVQTVALRQELKTAEDYLALINVQRNGGIRVIRDVEESLLDIRVLKFTLQPIVENSVLHGFKEQQDGTIRIDAHPDGNGNVVIAVQDSGRGMDQDTLLHIRRILAMEEISPKSRLMALKNVHDRIRLVFGPQYGVSIDLREEGGTLVRLLLPLLYTEAAEEDDPHDSGSDR